MVKNHYELEQILADYGKQSIMIKSIERIDDSTLEDGQMKFVLFLELLEK